MTNPNTILTPDQFAARFSPVRPALQLDPRTISLANDSSQFCAGDVLAREAQRVYESGLQDLTPLPDHTDEQCAYLAERAVEWCALVQEAYTDIIRRRASWVPWTVAGPSNYNARKNNAKADAQMNAAEQWREKFARFRENTARRLYELLPLADQIARYRSGADDSPISADDPHAVEKLAARLEYLKEQHAQNILLNKHYRKHGTMQNAPGLSAEQAARLDARLAALPECMRCVGFPANETANIRRLEQRLSDLIKAREAASAQPDNAARSFDGFSIVEDAASNRIRILFDDKPDDDARSLLKSHGFRWSPSACAWQRQLNENGRRAADHVAAVLASR